MSAAAPSSAPLPPIYDQSPPHGEVTDINHGAYVVIAAWIMMCFFTISVAARILTRLFPVVVGGIDDALSGFSMLFGIAQSAAIHIAASHGLGQHESALSEGSFAIYAKSYYASQILFLAAIFFAKISLIFFILRLSPAKHVHHACYAVLLAITLWAVAEILVTAFQCNPPRVWDYNGTCSVSQQGLYYSIAVGDIVTDLSLIILPAYVIWGVQIPQRKKIAVIGVFSSRIAVIICSALRLATLPHFLNSSDRSWEAVGPQTWIQTIQCLSIITACIPCLKPFLESLESGFMDISMKNINGTTYGGHSHQSNSSGRQGQRNTRDLSSNINSGNHDIQSSQNGSYLMTNMSAKPGTRGHTITTTHIIEPKDAELINGGRYLDVETNSDRGIPNHHGRNRANSIPDSERVLTAKSSDEYSNIPKDDGIRVTREVEVRHEEYNDDKYSYHSSRNGRW